MIPIMAAAIAVLAFGANPAAAGDVTYYDVTRGAHPHDVAPAPDGKVWYTAQSQGALGILDPKTGKVTQVPLGPGAAPHGVIVGPDRAAWITEGGQNAIARFDPATKAVKLFPLPKEFPDANLNTATFDRKGILWFTGQNGVYGRVDPASGKVDAWKAPKGAGAYGITTTPKGDVWYASLAGDHIAKIDTVSGDVMVVPPPKPGVGPRRIWSDSKGLLWVSFWYTGEVGRYDPNAKGWKIWSLPRSKATRSISTTQTRSGSPTSSPMRLCVSIRRLRNSRVSRATGAAPRCASCSAGRAKSGVRNPGPTDWS